MFVTEVMRRSAGVCIDAVRQGTRLAWWGANFSLEQMQRVFGSSGEPKPGMNDATLKAKVETELFRPTDAPKGRVTIGVVDGVVELRGTVPTQRQIRDLERRARGMPEVRDVENLLNSTQAPPRGRGAAPAPPRKRSASSSRGQRGRGGAPGSSPSAEKRPTPTATNRPAVSTEQRRPAASGQRPAPGGQRPTPGTDERPLPSTRRPAPGTPERPAPGGQRPTPGTDERPVPSARRPAPGTPERPAPITGERPAPRTSERRAPGTERPASSAGEQPAPGTGPRPTPSGSAPLRNVGAPGISRSHPRTNDVLGVLARQAGSGDHVNQAEICKELGLDATQVADVLRTLSTTNLVSRASTGNWELTPAGEREVEPGARRKEPRLQPREPQER